MVKITFPDKISNTFPADTGKILAGDINDLKNSVNDLHDHVDVAIEGVERDIIRGDAAATMQPVQTMTSPPGPNTPGNVITIVPGVGTYLGPIKIAEPPATVTPVAPTFATGSLAITGPNAPSFRAGDTITWTVPGVATGAPAPSLTYRVVVNSGDTYNLTTASFVIPAGTGGQNVRVDAILDNNVDPNALLSASVTVANPTVTFPTFLASQMTIAELTGGSAGVLQISIGASPAFDSDFYYFVTSPNYNTVDDAARDWNVANRATSGNLIAPGDVNLRPKKSAGTVVYPIVFAVHKQSLAYQILYQYGPRTITGVIGTYPTITHTATTANMATDASFKSWINALPAGAVGGIPPGRYNISANWTNSAPFPAKNPAIRLVPTDRENRPVFTKAKPFAFDYQWLSPPAGMPINSTPARNHNSAGGLILDGLDFDFSNQKVTDSGAASVGGKAFAVDYKPQGLLLYMDQILVTRCKFYDMYDSIGMMGAGVGVSNCEFIRNDCDIIFAYYGGGPYYSGFNNIHDWQRGPNNKEHSDACQFTAMFYSGSGISSAVIEANYHNMDQWPVLGVSDTYIQGYYLDNEAVAGTAQGTLVSGRNYWHGNLHFKGNRIRAIHTYGCGTRGWTNVQILDNLTEIPEIAGSGNVGPYFDAIGKTGVVEAHHGSGAISGNVMATGLERNSFRLPAARFTKSDNLTGNFDTAARKNSAGLGSAPFTTTNGSPTVTVVHAGHGMSTGHKVFISGAAAVGGLTLAGIYTITVTGSGAYTITAASNATSTATGGGAAVRVAKRPRNWVEGRAGNMTGGITDFPIPTTPTF